MRILTVDTYYPSFLRDVYESSPGLAESSYDEQWQRLMGHRFGTADFYSRNLKLLGHEATEVIANCAPLQLRWAREHGLDLSHSFVGLLRQRMLRKLPQWEGQVLMAQVRAFEPDVIHFQDPARATAYDLAEIRGRHSLLTAQIASRLQATTDFRRFDLVFSSLPHYVRAFREKGIRSELLRLGFEASILDRLPPRRFEHSVVHIGGYGPIHRERNEMLEAMIAAGTPLECWGYAADQLPAASPILSVYRGDAWGLAMYTIRYNSKIVVSKHISSVADKHANIMTLYEATGVGSLLLIDERTDMAEIFSPGREVVTYRSASEAVDLARYYLDHDEERELIAEAGQKRTLREHTYHQRMVEYLEIVEKYHGVP